MTFAAKTQSLHTNQELLSRCRVKSRSDFHKNVKPQRHGKSDVSKCLPVRKAHRSVLLKHLGKAVTSLALVESAAVNDYTADDSAMATHPLGS
jgi:hypothetical protein